MTDLMITVAVARTRLYRVLLLAANGAAAILLLVDRFGPGIGLTPWDIGVLDAALNSLIVLGRQIKDPSTPVNPDAGTKVLPTEGTIGPESGSAK